MISFRLICKQTHYSDRKNNNYHTLHEKRSLGAASTTSTFNWRNNRGKKAGLWKKAGIWSDSIRLVCLSMVFVNYANCW